MTYCAALRVNGVVHLIADGTVTWEEDDSASNETEQPFGEPHAAEKGRLTEHYQSLPPNDKSNVQEVGLGISAPQRRS